MSVSLLELFSNVLDVSKPETRANLRLIGDIKETGDTIEYLQVWTSLACCLWDSIQQGPPIQLPSPGLPPFIMAEYGHKTSMYWYEVVYRTKRAMK